MCLIVKDLHKSYSVAKRNIPCYKILRQIPDGSLITPYQRMHVNQYMPLTCEYFQKGYFIGGIVYMGIHSFNLYMDIREEVKRLQSSTTDKIGYVKAYIPKGTKYWLGDNHDFCSERIIIKDLQLCV